MRVFIYGAPGAGKTTLSLALAERFDLSVHHLDTVFFYPGGAPRDRQSGAGEAARLASGENWIIEGSHGAALEAVAARADRVILLRIGRWRGLSRLVCRRLWTPLLLSDKGPGGGPQILPFHLVRYTLLVHPRLEPLRIAQIDATATGEIRSFRGSKAAFDWFT